MKAKFLFILLLPFLTSAAFASSEKDNPFRKVAREVTPTVVQIDTVFKRKVPTGPSFFEYFFKDNNPKEDEEENYREYESTGLGSGVIVEANGKKKYVLTNEHVVEGADSLTVVFSNGDSYDAEVVGTDKRKDLALLVFETNDNIPVAKLGDSDDIYIGDWAMAIGSPLGYQSTVTLGIISATSRESFPGSTADITDFIQTDAAINRGNSGGPLVNIDGEVIGINSWIASQTGGNIGLGFAVPINNAKPVIRQLIETGTVEYGWLGVSIGSLESISEETKKDMGIEKQEGAFIHQVFIDSPADKGGIAPGDIVTDIDGEKIDDDQELLKIVGNLPAGKLSIFKVFRGGKVLTLNITPEKRTEETMGAKIWTGISPMVLEEEIIERYNERAEKKLSTSTKGIIVAGVMNNSIAKITGVRQGDIITHIDGRKVTNLQEYYRELSKTEEEVVFKVIRDSEKIKLILMKE